MKVLRACRLHGSAVSVHTLTDVMVNTTGECGVNSLTGRADRSGPVTLPAVHVTDETSENGTHRSCVLVAARR